ncbi:DUF4194 domain-containing protein [Ketobacter sp.]|uniref:DUF4194 domain-containing protein n=1 Tax=Ketobacter sp. TaxID=2083498 RepID=UPI000F1C36E6|nr:DUF4194 domain-containing protein [Ketobacter sp.]RLU00184.1 MAG: DUF4194 domain-containing protein [Ketobacter sp.]
MAGIFDQITGQPGGDSQSDQKELDEHLDELSNTDSQLSVDQTIEGAARTDKRLREAAQELLRYGLLEESQKPNLYRVSISQLELLNGVLEPFDFSAQVDEIRGLIFLVVKKPDDSAEFDEWSHPLVRKQRLTLEQSLLVAILRQYFIVYEQEAGTGASQAVVAVDELIPQLQVYLGDTGSEAKERNRMLQLLDQLKGHGLVSAPDTHDRITIRPMIAHLANPENLEVLLQWMHTRVKGSDDPQDKNEGDA